MSQMQRHNAKARQSSTSGSRKKGKKKRDKSSGALQNAVDTLDPNAEIIVPKSKDQRDYEKKEKLLKEVRCWHMLISCCSYLTRPFK